MLSHSVTSWPSISTPLAIRNISRRVCGTKKGGPQAASRSEVRTTKDAIRGGLRWQPAGLHRHGRPSLGPAPRTVTTLRAEAPADPSYGISTATEAEWRRVHLRPKIFQGNGLADQEKMAQGFLDNLLGGLHNALVAPEDLQGSLEAGGLAASKRFR